MRHNVLFRQLVSVQKIWSPFAFNGKAWLNVHEVSVPEDNVGIQVLSFSHLTTTALGISLPMQSFPGRGQLLGFNHEPPKWIYKLYQRLLHWMFIMERLPVLLLTVTSLFSPNETNGTGRYL